MTGHARRSDHKAIAAAFLLGGTLWGGWLGLGQWQGVDRGFEHIEALTLDWRFALIGPRPAPGGVVVVAIDDDTIALAGRYPLPREALARLVDRLVAFGVQAVGIDLLLLDPGGTAADAELARALGATRAVIGAVGRFEQAPAGGPVPSASSVTWPVAPLRGAARVGLVNVVTDRAGVARHVPLLFNAPGMILPSFVLATATAALNADPMLGRDLVRIAGRALPTDYGYHMPLRYYGPSGSIRRISAAAVLRGEIDPALVHGQVALVGVTATGSGDVFATPFDRATPGAEIMATAVSNLLAGDALVRSRPTRLIDVASAMLLPFAAVLLLAAMPPLAGAGLAAMLLALWLAAVVAAFANGIWLSIAFPLAALLPAALGYGLARLVFERRRGLRSTAKAAALARFQSPQLLDAISDPGFLAQPVRQDVAVVFLDLTGFTGIAEILGPELTRDLLAAFHDVVEREVTREQGYVVSFLGDGAMILFGVPAARTDDAARAVRAMTRLDDALAMWRLGLPPIARDRLAARITGHFGPAVVSRLGSAQQQYVTASGDTVNVASRFLEVAKERGVRLVVSDALQEAASAGVPASAAMFDVSLRGRSGVLRVHAWS